ncbi:hypothetical protein BgiBS90_012839, partial [Biomphalaria glabrata]
TTSRDDRALGVPNLNPLRSKHNVCNREPLGLMNIQFEKRKLYGPHNVLVVITHTRTQLFPQTCIVNKDNNEQDMHDDVEEGVHELSEIVSKMLNVDNQGLIHMEQF